MNFIRTLVVLAILTLSGCAAFPPARSALVGTHSASIGFNQGTSLVLKPDGTYQRSVSLFYCSPLIIETAEGEEETFHGWTNVETGRWVLQDRIVHLESDDRQIENPNVETKYFDDVLTYPITYKISGGWLLVYPSRQSVLMKKEPIQSPQRNAGSRPSAIDSSASETPSSLGPRG